MYQRTAALYDLMHEHLDYAKSAAAVEKIARETIGQPGTLLDVACGTGKHLEILQEFCKVSGVDINPEMVAIARERCPAVQIDVGDMRTLDLKRTFDVVVCLFSSIGYMQTVEELNDAVKALSAHVSDGGLLIIEPWLSPEAYQPGRVTCHAARQGEKGLVWTYIAERHGNSSIFRIRHLYADPATGISEFEETHTLSLFTDLQYQEAIRHAGMSLVPRSDVLFGYGLYVAMAESKTSAVHVKPASVSKTPVSLAPETPDLALFGAAPKFPEALHVGRPNIGDRSAFLNRVNQILDSRWLSNDGPLVTEFESRLQNQLGVKHCIAVANATAGLTILAKALNLQGDVIVPSFTFIATAHALSWIGLNPVFGDIDEHSHQLDPAKLEALISPRTSAIVGTHTWGMPCDVEALERIASRYGLHLIIDAAPAFGARFKGRQVGTFGAAEVFSFHATKMLNSFEGGAITTNDSHLAATARRMRSFGFVDNDLIASLGTNAKLSEIAAAMGLTSLESFDRFRDTNRVNFATYKRCLSGIPGVTLWGDIPAVEWNYNYVVVLVDAHESGLKRDELLEVLQAENILARRYFFPGCHRAEPYANRPSGTPDQLQVTERVASRVLCLPTGTAVGEHDIAAVCNIIRTAVAHSDAVASKLRISPST